MRLGMLFCALLVISQPGYTMEGEQARPYYVVVPEKLEISDYFLNAWFQRFAGKKITFKELADEMMEQSRKNMNEECVFLPGEYETRCHDFAQQIVESQDSWVWEQVKAFLPAVEWEDD